MAYNKEELEQEILKVIDEQELTFISEIPVFIPASLATLYNHDLEKLESIKNALAKNKVKQKSGMRKKWRNSDNPALQIAAFKLIAEPEEIEKLTTTKSDVNLKGDLNVNWNETKNYGANDKTNEGS